MKKGDIFFFNKEFKIEIKGLEEEIGVLKDENSELLVRVKGSKEFREDLSNRIEKVKEGFFNDLKDVGLSRSQLESAGENSQNLLEYSPANTKKNKHVAR